MRRAPLRGLATLVVMLAPMSAWAQPQQAPIVATPLPLLPPSSAQYPQAAPAPGQPQYVPPPQGQPFQAPPPSVQYPPPAQPPGQPRYVPAPQGQPVQELPLLPPPSVLSPPGAPAPTQPYAPTPNGQPAPAPPQGLQPPSTTHVPAPGQPSAPGQPAAPEQSAPTPPNTWLPQGGAVLQMLDKVNAQTTTLTVADGHTGTFGSLIIAVQACEIRPPDMPQDAAAFLTITDSHPDQPGFKGWMLKSDPSLAMLEHPLYDVRVIGCTP